MTTDTKTQEQRPAQARHPHRDSPVNRPVCPDRAAVEATGKKPGTFGDRDGELDRLVLNAQGGSSAALDALVRRTHPEVTRYIARRVHSDQVEELVQETYLRVLGALPRFAGRAPVRAWLFAIARNTVADRYRYDAVRPTCVYVHPEGWDVLPAARATRFDEYLPLLTLLGELPAERRQAFVLTQVEGLTYAEAARLADVPVGTIRSRVARARDELLREFTA